jgi:hypothetical protein
VDVARKDAWGIAQMLGLHIPSILNVAQRQGDRYMVHIGSNHYLPFERLAQGYREIRIKAVQAVNPGWEQEAFDRSFQRIINKQ